MRNKGAQQNAVDKQKKKKKHSLQKINEDTEQLDIWYTVYCPSAVCGCAPPTYFI